jgi:hypothetical protein
MNRSVSADFTGVADQGAGSQEARLPVGYLTPDLSGDQGIRRREFAYAAMGEQGLLGRPLVAAFLVCLVLRDSAEGFSAGLGANSSGVCGGFLDCHGHLVGILGRSFRVWELGSPTTFRSSGHGGEGSFPVVRRCSNEPQKGQKVVKNKFTPEGQ